jgi:hypothetical protein
VTQVAGVGSSHMHVHGTKVSTNHIRIDHRVKWEIGYSRRKERKRI